MKKRRRTKTIAFSKDPEQVRKFAESTNRLERRALESWKRKQKNQE